MEKTIRLTTAQALLKFLNQQYISIDGKEHLMWKESFMYMVMGMF